MIYCSRNRRSVARHGGPADGGGGRKSIHFSQMRTDTGAPNCILKISERFPKTATGIKVPPPPAPSAVHLFRACEIGAADRIARYVRVRLRIVINNARAPPHVNCHYANCSIAESALALPTSASSIWDNRNIKRRM